MMHVTVYIEDGGSLTQYERDIPEVMASEIRLMRDIWSVVTNSNVSTLAEVFTRLCVLGLDTALMLYGKERYKAKTDEFCAGLERV